MKQVHRVKTNIFNRPQFCGKFRCGVSKITEAEAFAQLEKAVKRLVNEARWAYYLNPINELRAPLLQLKLARRNKTN